MTELRFSVVVKYWHDSHDFELIFATKADARSIYESLCKIAVNSENDIEWVSLWDNNDLLETMCL